MDELQDLTVKNAQESEQNKGESWVSKLRYTKSFLAKIARLMEINPQKYKYVAKA